MRQRRISYKPTTVVSCSDNGKSLVAEVLSFDENKRLVVSLNRSVRMEMTYNTKSKLYIAHQTGLEFVSSGPEIIDTGKVR